MAKGLRSRRDAIRQLNDGLRTRFSGGSILHTRGVASLPQPTRFKVLEAVRTFNRFTKDIDPHREHDMAFFGVEGERYFFKIDYYDRSLQNASPDPTDPSVTIRVLTIGRADEY